MDFDPSIIPTQLNPDLTPGLAQEVSFFRKWGYLVVEDALTAGQVESLRAALDDTVRRNETDRIRDGDLPVFCPFSIGDLPICAPAPL